MRGLRLLELGAALLADANLVALVVHVVAGAGGLAALGAHQHDVGHVDGGLLLDEATLR